MTADRMELRVGEERAVHLPSGGAWHAEIEGMASAGTDQSYQAKDFL